MFDIVLTTKLRFFWDSLQAVHPVSNLYDLKRRLGVGRRCYGYFHPAIPGKLQRYSTERVRKI